MLSVPERTLSRTRLEDLSRHLQSLRGEFGEVTRPVAEGIWDGRDAIDAKRRLYALSQQDFSRFPVELSGVLLGDRLRAYFACFPFVNSDKSLETRVNTDALLPYIEFVREGRRSPVTEWNLLQLNAAQAFGQLAASSNAGVAVPLVETFQTGTPTAFRAALDIYAPIRR